MDGTDKVSMDWATGSKFLGLLGLVEGAQIVASHNNGSGGNTVEGAESFDCQK